MGADRRQFLRRTAGATVAGATAATSGCLDVILGSEPLSFSASPAEVRESALAAAGYERVRTDPLTWQMEFEVAGQTRSVEVNNHLAEYRRTVSLPGGESVEGAVFAALATPVVEIAEESLNPLERLENPEIVARVQDAYGDVRVQERLPERTAAVLGSERAFQRLVIRTVLAGTGLEALLHLTTFRDSGDVLGLVGLHPRALPAEAELVYDLARAVEHGGG